MGVTAGASAPEEVVEAVIDRLAPVRGVEEVSITEEDEYFPPPRNLRDLLAALDGTIATTLGGPTSSADLDDRSLEAADVPRRPGLDPHGVGVAVHVLQQLRLDHHPPQSGVLPWRRRTEAGPWHPATPGGPASNHRVSAGSITASITPRSAATRVLR